MKNNLLLGITGSIAASKTEKLYELFNDHYNIKLVSTSEGLKYLDDNFKTNNKGLNRHIFWTIDPSTPI